jgi:hypothetical protein
MLYLPIDKLIEQRGSGSGREASRDTIVVRPAPATETPSADDRTRGTR